MNNKVLFRLGCFCAALLLGMLALTVHSSLQVQHYRRQMQSQYLRSLQEISGQMNAITIDLQKTTYAGTPVQVSAASARVWKSAATAKSALGGLPLQDLNLESTNRFLSQVGDYCMYLSRKSISGEEITAEERQNLEHLLEYARALGYQIADLEYLASTGQLSLDDMTTPNTPTPQWEEPVAVSLDFSGLEQQLEGYPTLIYDGPFSDNLLQKSPIMTQGEPEITVDQAREIASVYTGLLPTQLVQAEEERSHMPSWVFNAQELAVGVTRQGGHVTYLVSGREIGPRTLSFQEARYLARAYLEARGIGAMQETYYELSGGILTVNYAWTLDDTVCYTDLIKVGVAMDDGQIVFYDARGYINNHHERSLPIPALDEEDALASVSPSLTPLGAQLALIPTAGGGEVLTWEWKCLGRDGEHVLVYINVETGAEEQILILIESDTGTLTM